jgi:hypothetical protein
LDSEWGNYPTNKSLPKHQNYTKSRSNLCSVWIFKLSILDTIIVHKKTPEDLKTVQTIKSTLKIEGEAYGKGVGENDLLIITSNASLLCFKLSNCCWLSNAFIFYHKILRFNNSVELIEVFFMGQKFIEEMRGFSLMALEQKIKKIYSKMSI